MKEDAGALVVVVAEDTRSGRATDPSVTPELDTVVMFLERMDQHLRAAQSLGIVVADRPGGSSREGDAFLNECLGTIRSGTTYTSLERIVLMVTEDSRRSRLSPTRRCHYRMHDGPCLR
jgi:hypothetical protein